MNDSLENIINNPVVEIGKDAIERSFNTSPDTVYGILVGLLVIGLFVCFYLYIRMSRRAMDDLVQLNKDTVETFTNVNAVLISINEKSEQQHTTTLTKMKEHLFEGYFEKVRTQIGGAAIEEIKENRIAQEKSHERIMKRLEVIESKLN